MMKKDEIISGLIGLAMVVLLVMVYGGYRSSVSGVALPFAGSKTAEYSKVKQTVGLSKKQVKDLLGTPVQAMDTIWSYDAINPDSEKKQTCILNFSSEGIVTSVSC